jgi:hypothetical protein
MRCSIKLQTPSQNSTIKRQAWPAGRGSASLGFPVWNRTGNILGMAYRRIPRELRGEVIACLRYAFPSQIVGKFKNKVCPATIYSWIAETMSWTDEDWKQVEPFVAKARRRSWK